MRFVTFFTNTDNQIHNFLLTDNGQLPTKIQFIYKYNVKSLGGQPYLAGFKIKLTKPPSQKLYMPNYTYKHLVSGN